MTEHHDIEMCWCRECMDKLFAANAEYFRAWLERDKARLRDLQFVRWRFSQIRECAADCPAELIIRWADDGYKYAQRLLDDAEAKQAAVSTPERAQTALALAKGEK